MKIDLIVERVPESESSNSFTRVVAWLERFPIYKKEDDFDDARKSVLNAFAYFESFGIMREDIDTWVEKEVVSKKRIRYEG